MKLDEGLQCMPEINAVTIEFADQTSIDELTTVNCPLISNLSLDFPRQIRITKDFWEHQRSLQKLRVSITIWKEIQPVEARYVNLTSLTVTGSVDKTLIKFKPLAVQIFINTLKELHWDVYGFEKLVIKCTELIILSSISQQRTQMYLLSSFETLQSYQGSSTKILISEKPLKFISPSKYKIRTIEEIPKCWPDFIIQEV